jgi:hypothetical protein
MQRVSVTGDIFGYLVCLLATFIFFVSVAAIVNNAFQVVHPTAQPRLFVRHVGARFGGPAWAGPRNWQAHAPSASGSAAGPGPQGLDRRALRDRFIAGARYNAVRHLVVALVMLALSIAVFRRTFVWLNPREMVT